jgi:hypothetical protein
MTMTNDISRRTVFAAAGAAAMTGAMTGALSGSLDLGLVSAANAQGAAPAQAPGFYRMKIGDAIVTAINDGFARRPLEGFIRNAELSDVQKAMGAAFLPTDQITIPFTTLVVHCHLQPFSWRSHQWLPPEGRHITLHQGRSACASSGMGILDVG